MSKNKRGRKELPKEQKRVHLSTKVAPETKEKIKALAGKKKVGRWLDEHFNKTNLQ